MGHPRSQKLEITKLGFEPTSVWCQNLCPKLLCNADSPPFPPFFPTVNQKANLPRMAFWQAGQGWRSFLNVRHSPQTRIPSVWKTSLVDLFSTIGSQYDSCFLKSSLWRYNFHTVKFFLKCCSMSFDKRLLLCRHQHNQDIEYFHYLPEVLWAPLQSIPCPYTQPLATTHLFSISVVLPFPEYCINGIISYVYFWVWLYLA